MSKREVWLVEDDNASRKALIGIISAKDREISFKEFDNAETAVETIKTNIPDLIIFDNILKGKLKGIDAVEIIKKKINIPILIYSATPTEDLLNRCINLDMVRYISKPVKPIELDFHIKSLFKVHKTEKRLKTSLLRYKSIFNESIDMIFVTTPDGRFIDINNSGVKMLGYSDKSELLNLDISSNFYVNKKDRERYNNEIQSKGFIKDFQTKIKRKDNSIISIIESATIFNDKESNDIYYLGIVRDITKQLENEQSLIRMNVEQIENNKKLQNTQAMLIQQEKMASLGNLSAGIAHEINNPLGFIVSNFRTLKNYAETIKDFINYTNSENSIDKEKSVKLKKKLSFIMEDLDDIFKETDEGLERITSIVSNMRQFARVDSENKKKPANINSLIENTLVIARNSYKYVADIKLDLGDIPDINCISSEINQVLLNIIVNAAQAIESLNKKDKGLISIKTYADGKMVCCEIKDNGSGIPEKNINKVFDPFFTTKEIGKGTGIGLNISYDIIVNKHKGKIDIKSTGPEGTTFLIKLPKNQSI